MKINFNKLINIATILLFIFSTNTIGISNTVINEFKSDNIFNKQNANIDISISKQQDPWPMFRHDLKHTGRSVYSGPTKPIINWSYKTNDSIISSAAIVADGTIYLGLGWDKTKPKDTYLYAFNEDGNIKWKFESTEGFFSSPSIDNTGTIYIVGLDGYLYSIEDNEDNATLNWKKYLDYSFNLCSPSIGHDGTINVGSPSFKYYNIRTDGSIKWDYSSDWCIISSPAIDDSGIVYIGSKDHNLYAFNPEENKLEWKFPTGIFYDGHLVDSSPAIGVNGTIYVGTDPYGAWGQTPKIVDINFWAIYPNGTLKWSFETEDGVESSPAIGEDGTIYFGSYDGYLYAVKDSGNIGTLQWKYKTNGAIDSSPIIDGNGIIYVSSRDKNLYAIYPNGTTKWIFENNGEFEASPSLDSNGHILIGDFNGNFYCLGEGGPDVGVESINTPKYLTPGDTIYPQATIRNYRGSDQIFNVSCIVKLNNNTIYEDNKLIELSGGESKILNFSQWMINNSQNLDYVMIISTNLTADENFYNDEKIRYMTTSDNFAPFKPSIQGPNNGEINKNYTYNFLTLDLEDDDIFYMINWGDQTQLEWFGPYNSGESINFSHSWSKKNDYQIKAKAKDIHGAESDWSIFEISMPKTKLFDMVNTWSLRIIQRFPLLKYLL